MEWFLVYRITKKFCVTFWSGPSHLENVTTVPCEMQISCIWSTLHCFRQRSGCILNSHFATQQLKSQTSNIAAIVFFVLTFALSYFLYCVGIQTNMNLLTVGSDVCIWDGQCIPHTSWLLPPCIRGNLQVHRIAICHWWKNKQFCALRTLFIGSYECQRQFIVECGLFGFHKVAFVRCGGQFCEYLHFSSEF